MQSTDTTKRGSLLYRGWLAAIGRQPEETPTTWEAFGLMVLWGGLYSILYLSLHLGGHSPTVDTFLPVDGSRYYLAASIYALPAACLLTFIAGATAGFIYRFNWTDSMAAVRVFSGPYAGPFLWFLVLPELTAYSLFGFDALVVTARLALPVVAISVTLNFYRAARRQFGVSAGRGAAMTLGAFLAQSAPLVFLFR